MGASLFRTKPSAQPTLPTIPVVVEEKKKKVETFRGWRQELVAFLGATHPRLGDQSPAALLDMWTIRDIAALLRTGAASTTDRKWMPRSEVVLSNDDHTVRQIPDCYNFVITAAPPIVDGEIAFWELHIDKIGSGSMRYAGLHEPRDRTVSQFSPEFNFGLQTGRISKGGEEGLTNVEGLSITTGDVVGLLANRSDEEIDDGCGGVVKARSMVIWLNHKRLTGDGGKPASITLPKTVDLFPALTLQTENDTVTATFGLKTPCDLERH